MNTSDAPPSPCSPVREKPGPCVFPLLSPPPRPLSLASLLPRQSPRVQGIFPENPLDDPPCLLLLSLVPVNARHRDRPDRLSPTQRGSPLRRGRAAGRPA